MRSTVLVFVALSGATGCCSTYATEGCLTPGEIRAEPAAYLADTRSWVREEAARAAARSPEVARASRETLAARLSDASERPWVRAASAEALGVAGGSDELLAGVASSPGTPPEVKIAAIDALCRPGAGAGAAQAIAPLAADEDLLVAAVARARLAGGCSR